MPLVSAEPRTKPKTNLNHSIDDLLGVKHANAVRVRLKQALVKNVVLVELRLRQRRHDKVAKGIDVVIVEVVSRLLASVGLGICNVDRHVCLPGNAGGGVGM
jgi:hypothetical protein